MKQFITIDDFEDVNFAIKETLNLRESSEIRIFSKLRELKDSF